MLQMKEIRDDGMIRNVETIFTRLNEARNVALFEAF